MHSFLVLLLFSMFLIYIFVFYNVFVKQTKNQDRIKKFHYSIVTIHRQNLSIEKSIDQIIINYNKLFQDSKLYSDSDLVNLLEELTCSYYTLNDKVFERKFNITKDDEVAMFIYETRKQLLLSDPFISLPAKEAGILKTLKEAINKSNFDLANSYLNLLSKEIVTKENILIKQERTNKNATIVSVAGIILTVVFGALSFLN